MWQLVICAGITWAGCGTASVSLYPSEDSCYRALKALRIADQPVAESDKKRSEHEVSIHIDLLKTRIYIGFGKGYEEFERQA